MFYLYKNMLISEKNASVGDIFVHLVILEIQIWQQVKHSIKYIENMLFFAVSIKGHLCFIIKMCQLIHTMRVTRWIVSRFFYIYPLCSSFNLLYMSSHKSRKVSHSPSKIFKSSECVTLLVISWNYFFFFFSNAEWTIFQPWKI